MYPHHPSSSSSSSSQPISQTGTGTGLTRYGSAPSSLLNSTVEAVLAAGGSRLLPPGGGAHAHYYSSSGDSASDTTCKENNIRSSPSSYHHDPATFGSASLLRQKSSPAGFLSHLHNLNHNHNSNPNHNHNGFTITRGSSHSQGGGSRLKSELSFTAQGQECLSRISENVVVDASTSYSQPWGGQDGDNSIVFSAPPKRSKTNDPDFLNSLTALDSQFSMPQTTLEMAAVENMLHIPQDSVPCKIRAKRGCATHPRSIAERERRTRISGKLKKLQDLVPNMDKQTSYADMLDLAVQHIKGLQGQVQKLHNELENCTCGCKQST